MGKTLVIAEKPSVATDISRVIGKQLGKFNKKGKDRNTYYENEEVIISSAVGHVVELQMPLGDDGKKLPWNVEVLPVKKDKIKLQPKEKSKSRLKMLLGLIEREDIDQIINACDAGREGELIFRYIMEMTKVPKPPLKRMWMQSMTDHAIAAAFEQLREDEEMVPLRDAAFCRSESDWLVGLNGTRALTAFNSRRGGFNVTNAGRVQTPTLVILAEREREIRNFKPRDYWEIHADFEVYAGTYSGRWFREEFSKEEDDQARAERIWEQSKAETIRRRCTGKLGIVEEIKKPSKQAPPQLYDLTTLQREAGFSAKNTLGIAQALYERHKLLTYPRTDSKCLPEDYISTVRSHFLDFSSATPSAALAKEVIAGAAKVLRNDWIKPSKRIFNNAKISDHFAIIPTGKIPTKRLKEQEQKIYDMVMRRFISIFFPPAEFENTRRITRVEEDSFLSTGKILVTPGYLEVYGRKPGVAAEKDELVPTNTGEEAKVVDMTLKRAETKPPAYYTDSTLLSAMENAGKRVDDDELREAMSERGLGTPATRAAIIEGLISHKYVFRHEQQKQSLVVSNKGLALVTLLDEVGVEIFRSPEMTAEWEYKLKQMESGEFNRKDFMDEIEALTQKIADQTRQKLKELENKSFNELETTCPSCTRKNLKQTDINYECKNPECKFKLSKYIASHNLVPGEAKELLEKMRIGPFDDFKSRFGKPFKAEIKLAQGKRGGWKPEFIFEGDEEREEESKNLGDDQSLCETTLEDGSPATVYQTDQAYICPKMATDKQRGGTRIAKEILKNEIPEDQAIKLFAEGKTDVISGFISKKGRPFRAYLLLDKKTGKLGWEFPPRAKKVAKKKVKKSKSKKKSPPTKD